MSSKRSRPSRRGRPPAGTREQRRAAVLDAAHDELVAGGYEGMTMLAVARRAGASKETLYRWFGNREGLLTAMVEANGDVAAERVRAALSGAQEPLRTLVDFSAGLLTLLTGPRSVALNRAAMTTPDLAHVLLTAGRHRVGPLVEAYLSELHDDGVIAIDSPAEAFQLLYGLVVRDTQIRVLLGEKPPSSAEIAARAERAVGDFFSLLAPTAEGGAGR